MKSLPQVMRFKSAGMLAYKTRNQEAHPNAVSYAITVDSLSRALVVSEFRQSGP
jgi:hypothetical protein